MITRNSDIDPQHPKPPQHLTEGEENYQKIIELAREGVIIHVQGEIFFVNAKLVEILGFNTSSEIVGRPVRELVQKDRREISAELEDLMLEESEELMSIEDVYTSKDGTPLPVEVSAIPIHYQGNPAVQLVVRDISERKKVEAEIWEYQNMLKRLALDLTLAEEAERRKLAIVLHDHLGQSLAMAKIKLAGALTQVKDDDLSAQLTAVEKDISDAVKQTRSITYELSPPVLHELGIAVALEWRLEKLTDETGIRTSIDNKFEQVRLRNEQEVILFRSVDEILKNIVKHAEATIVLVTVMVTKYSFMIRIQDNGKGFDTSILEPQGRKAGSFGLFSIKERIEYLGGILDIQSNPTGGTEVILNVPVSLEGF